MVKDMSKTKTYEICIPTEEEAETLDDKLLQEIQKIKPITQKSAFVPINVCAKSNGELIGGVLAYAVMWDILYIDTVGRARIAADKGLQVAC